MNALKALVQSSVELGVIVGHDPLARSEVTKRVWNYIKDRNLQDQTNRRMINADQSLRVIFGGRDQVSMFELAALVNKHLTPYTRSANTSANASEKENADVHQT